MSVVAFQDPVRNGKGWFNNTCKTNFIIMTGFCILVKGLIRLVVGECFDRGVLGVVGSDL
jgi:hypothetical protein